MLRNLGPSGGGKTGGGQRPTRNNPEPRKVIEYLRMEARVRFFPAISTL